MKFEVLTEKKLQVVVGGLQRILENYSIRSAYLIFLELVSDDVIEQ